MKKINEKKKTQSGYNLQNFQLDLHAIKLQKKPLMLSDLSSHKRRQEDHRAATTSELRQPGRDHWLLQNGHPHPEQRTEGKYSVRFVYLNSKTCFSAAFLVLTDSVLITIFKAAHNA